MTEQKVHGVRRWVLEGQRDRGGDHASRARRSQQYVQDPAAGRRSRQRGGAAPELSWTRLARKSTGAGDRGGARGRRRLRTYASMASVMALQASTTSLGQKGAKSESVKAADGGGV